MEVKNIFSIDSGYKDTIPLFIDKDNNHIRILHGNKEFIKISEYKDNKLEELSSIQLKSLKSIYSILFNDLDNDGNKELLYFNKKGEIIFFRFENNEFNPLESQDFSHELKMLSDKEDIQIKLLKKLNEELIVIGTNYGLLLCTIDKNLKIKCKEFIKEKTIWECVLSKLSKNSDEFFFIGSENKILILDSNYQKIFEITTNQRVYQIDLFDFDNCGINEIICCTQKGKIYIYKVYFKENLIFNYSEFFSKKLIFEDDCGRARNPAINTFILFDLNNNERINIIIGGHDYKIKFYKWNPSKHNIEMILSCELPKEQVYSIKIFNDRYNNLCLLYSTFVEEISFNHLIVYHNAQSKFTKRIIKSIGDRIIQEPVKFCFFLGAGFSYNENNHIKSAPLAKNLIKELYSKFNISEDSIPFSKYKDSLEYIFFYLKKLYPNALLKEFIKERFGKNFATTRAIKILSNLIKQGFIKQVFTVNWDLLLEKQVKDILNIYYKFSDFNLNNLKLPFYMKLHGTSSDIDSIIASIDELELNEYNYSLILKRNILKLFYDSNNFIFIGYSFHDVDFIDIFKYKLYNNNINIYIFDPNPNKMMYEIINNRIKIYQEEKFHFHIFKCKADEFFEELFNHIIMILKRYNKN